MVTVKTKDVGEVREFRNKNATYKKQLEDCNEEYIKINMGAKWV